MLFMRSCHLAPFNEEIEVYMSFTEETKKELFLAYGQLFIILLLDFVFVGIPILAEIEFKAPIIFQITIGVFGFFTLISIIRIILLHLAIYYWKRGD